MVNGKEIIFEDVDEALKYVLQQEKVSLKNDEFRQKPPLIVSTSSLFNYPFEPKKMGREISADSLDSPFPAYFNEAPNDDVFIMNRLLSGRYSLKPNLKNRHYLFRGESEFHSPCKPNLFRNSRQNYYIEEVTRVNEMLLLLLSHPLVQLLDLGVMLHGEKYRFEMNLYGLTQHYYNKSCLLDLTSNPQVAAFFATSIYDAKNDSYVPIVDENHENGILYYYDLDLHADFKIGMMGMRSPLSTIGLQVFPRSGAQYGFLYAMEREDDFNNVARLHAVRFKHKASASKKYNDFFHSGRDLFPDDILAKHWKNQDNKTLSDRTVLLNLLFNPSSTKEEIVRELLKRGYKIEKYLPSFTEDEMDEYYDSIKAGYWENFCNKIYIPGDKGELKKELLDLPNNPEYKWAFEKGITHQINYRDGYLLRRYEACLV